MSDQNRSDLNPKRTLPPLLVFILCSALTCAAWYVARRSSQVENTARFERSAASLLYSFRNRMTIYTNSLITTRNLFEIKPKLNVHEFHLFADGMELKTQLPGIQNIGYVRRTTKRELPWVMAQLPYKAQELEDKPIYDIVMYVESFVSTPNNAIGMDLSVEPVRKEAMERAAELGVPVASNMVTPISNPKPGPDDLFFLLFVPHYKKDAPIKTPEERKKAITGFVYGAFKAGNLFGHVAGDSKMQMNNLILRVYDGKEIQEKNLMYSHGDMAQASQQYYKVIKLNAADHHWTIVLAATDAFSLPYSRFYPYIILFIGILLTIAVTYSSSRNAKLYRELDAANRAKSIFLANVSHEMRTPLGIMVGFAELAQEHRNDPAMVEEYVTKIRRSGHELTRIIGEVLDIAKIEANTLLIENVEFPLQKMIDEVEGMWRAHAEAKGLKFSITTKGVLPEKLCTDQTRLKQILVNLLSNAIKFTERGHIRLKVEAHDKEVEFIVEDSGPGISLDNQLHLFKTFSQGDSSVTRKYGGSGLGLALSKQLALALQGDLILDRSEIGSGSVFKLTLPVRPQDYVETKTASGFSLPPEMTMPIKGKRVLLVEDSRENQILISTFLNKAEAVVDVANNGEEGAAMALKGSYDVVLMDIQMPVLDGYGAFAKLRQATYARPVIALTAHALRDEKEKAISLGFASYLTKPVDRNLLILTIAEVLA